MSGFGYVRDTKPVVTDWAQVGRDMGKVITDEFTDREARKADIEKQSAEIAKNLLDSPVGQYEEANRFVSDFSSQAQQQALADLRLLKNNQISEREYYNRRANLKSGTDLMFTAVQKFNENYDGAMQNILDGKSSVLLSDLKSQMQGYLNFADSGTYINPATASVNVSKLNPDGTVSTDPSNFMNAGMLLKLSTTDFKNFELDKTVKNVTDNLGKITYRAEDGTTKSVSMFDIGLLTTEEREKFKRDEAFQEGLNNALNDEVEAIVGDKNSQAAASILADHSGKKYSLKFDPKLFNEDGTLKNPNAETNDIAYSPNGQVVLTDKQLQDAKDLVRRKLQQQLGASILEPVAPSELDDEYKRARIRALNRSGQKDDDVDDYVEFMSNQNTTLDKDANLAVTKKTVENLDDPLDSKNRITTTDTLKNILDNNKAFKGLKRTDLDVSFNEGGEIIEEASVRQNPSGKSIVTVPEKRKEASVTLMVKKLQDFPLNIPDSENNQMIVRYFALLDKAKQEGRKLGPSDYTEIFGSEELFKIYNPNLEATNPETNTETSNQLNISKYNKRQ